MAPALLAFIALIGVWAEVGSEFLWKSIVSLMVIGFGALIVAAIAPLLSQND